MRYELADMFENTGASWNVASKMDIRATRPISKLTNVSCTQVELEQRITLFLMNLHSVQQRLHRTDIDGLDSEGILLVSTPISKENPWGWTGISHLAFSSVNLMRRLVTRRLFTELPCRKGTIHLQASMHSPGYDPRSYGTKDNTG
ncbi:hypothetical protein TNCV_947651 [Trichonephila clavipes]|nr:hypothetical protein TNCV_947651 [Trichonephila clavipes]